MKYDIQFTNQFKKDLKLAKKQNKNLDKYTGNMVCSKQLYKEALNHAFDEPKQWEIREINEIMNQCIDRWRYFPNPRMFSEYGRQKGWERENPATDSGNPSEKTMDGFVEVTEQMELPFWKWQPVASPVAIPLPSRLPGKNPYFRAFLPYNNQNNRKIKEKYK